jgi:hypothetical protein
VGIQFFDALSIDDEIDCALPAIPYEPASNIPTRTEKAVSPIKAPIGLPQWRLRITPIGRIDCSMYEKYSFGSLPLAAGKFAVHYLATIAAQEGCP